MGKITTRPDHSTPIGIFRDAAVAVDRLYQLFFDDLLEKLNTKLFGNQIVLESYTVATLPTVPAATSPGLIYVSDETGGAVPAFSDGTNWRRVTDRAIVS